MGKKLARDITSQTFFTSATAAGSAMTTVLSRQSPKETFSILNHRAFHICSIIGDTIRSVEIAITTAITIKLIKNQPNSKRKQFDRTFLLRKKRKSWEHLMRVRATALRKFTCKVKFFKKATKKKMNKHVRNHFKHSNYHKRCERFIGLTSYKDRTRYR